MRRRPVRLLTGTLLLTAGVLAAGCGSSAPAPTFRPSGGQSSSPAASSAPAASTTVGGVSLPPFGGNVHIDMTTWLPANPTESAAVRAVKSFLLAFLYADYTGGRDNRWTQYISGATVRNGLAQTLSAPDVTTESFKGTMRIWHMSAVYVPGPKGSVDITECIDSSHLLNTSLHTGKVLPRREQSTKEQSLYANSDQLVKVGGQWRIFSIPQPIYYPRAVECQ